MGFTGDSVNKGIKLVGILAKGGSELTGTFIGSFKENVLKQIGEKEKFSTKGRIKGRILKRNIDNMANKSGEIVDESIQIAGRGLRKSTIIVLKGLNEAAKITYEGTEKLKKSFDEYNKSKDFLKNDNKKSQDINMTIVENLEEVNDINKEYYEYEMELNSDEQIYKEKKLGQTQIMDIKDVFDFKNKL